MIDFASRIVIVGKTRIHARFTRDAAFAGQVR